MSGTNKKVIDLFVEISKAGKSARNGALFVILLLLIAGIIGAVKFSATWLLLPLCGFFLARPYINTLHDRNIKKYLSKHQNTLDATLVKHVSELSKEQKLHYCKEALLIEIRSKLQAKNMLPDTTKPNS